MAESTFDDEDSDEYVDDQNIDSHHRHPQNNIVDIIQTPRKGDLQIIDLEDDQDEELSTTFIENVDNENVDNESDDESSSYEKKFVRGLATPTGSVTMSSNSSVASPALTPSIGAAANVTSTESEDEIEEENNVTLSPNEVVVIGTDTTFVTSDHSASPSPPGKKMSFASYKLSDLSRHI